MMQMRPGGIDTDIRTGRPVAPPKPEEQKAKVVRRLEMAVQDAWALSAELHQNKVAVRKLFEKYWHRLAEIAQKDERLQALDEVIQTLREPLEIVPIMAKREALRRLGPNLAALVEETDAAP